MAGRSRGMKIKDVGCRRPSCRRLDASGGGHDKEDLGDRGGDDAGVRRRRKAPDLDLGGCEARWL